MYAPVEQSIYIYIYIYICGGLVVCNGDGIRPCLKSNQLNIFFCENIRTEDFRNPKNRSQD
jgi:hypothetical protein